MYPEQEKASRCSRPRGQRGVSMLFALCALAVMTLGAVALVRSVDTGMLVLGNLGFKKDAVAAASVATEAAIVFLQTARKNTPLLLNDKSEDNGYYPQAYEQLDPTGGSAASASHPVLVNWDNNGCKIPAVGSKTPVCLTPKGPIEVNAHNTAQYVITRLCRLEGPIDNVNDCVRPVTQPVGRSSQRGKLGYGSGVFPPRASDGATFRILTRTVGVRGTVAYTETLVHF